MKELKICACIKCDTDKRLIKALHTLNYSRLEKHVETVESPNKILVMRRFIYL